METRYAADPAVSVRHRTDDAALQSVKYGQPAHGANRPPAAVKPPATQRSRRQTPRSASQKRCPGHITLRGFLSMKTALRRILSESARLDVPPETLADDADLYAAGLSSLATVHLMLAIEDEFGIEIPDRMLTRRLFSSIDSLSAAVSELQQAK